MDGFPGPNHRPGDLLLLLTSRVLRVSSTNVQTSLTKNGVQSETAGNPYFRLDDGAIGFGIIVFEPGQRGASGRENPIVESL
jgi:hypothetical protein